MDTTSQKVRTGTINWKQGRICDKTDIPTRELRSPTNINQPKENAIILTLMGQQETFICLACVAY